MSIIDTLLDIKGDIADIKEDVREQTGSNKYDDCYDDCLKLIDIYIARIEVNKEKKIWQEQNLAD